MSEHRTHRLALVAAALVVATLALLTFQARDSHASGAQHGSGATTTHSLPQDTADESESERLHVQLWTVLAAGGAASVGLLLFLLRIYMGWTKAPPPPQEDAAAH